MPTVCHGGRLRTSPVTHRQIGVTTMNVVVLRGTLSSEPRARTLPSGSEVLNWELTTRTDEATRTVPVQWDDPPSSVRRFGAGDEVVLSGTVRRRFFRAGGATASRTEVLAEAAARAGDGRGRRRVLDRALVQLES